MPFRARWFFAAAAIAFGSIAQAQDRKWYFNAFAGQSVIFLGSKDNRTLGGVGAFPNFRRARVVWIGVATDPRLELLHHDLEVACGEAGFEVEGRPFRPHITLARVRTPLMLDQVKPFARAARRVAYAASDEVRALGLLESTLGSSAAGYRRVHAAPLGGC